MQILMISGFLGAGKTRFIQHMAKALGRQFVIVENEFAEVGIDAAILEEEKQKTSDEQIEKNLDKMEIWELSEGCICCSTNIDFSQTVITIESALSPDFLVVEPSGVAFPQRIIEKLRPILYERIGLLAPVMLLDGQQYAQSKFSFPEYFDGQIESAGTIVLSKSEHFSPSDYERIEEDLDLPADIHFPKKHYETWTKEEWESLLHKEIVWDREKKSYHIEEKRVEKPKEENLQTYSLVDVSLENPMELCYILDQFVQGKYGNIVRSKGYLACGTSWLRFDLVGAAYIIESYKEMPQSTAVMIGQNLDKSALKELWENLRLS